jgi:hypothetical protein
MRVCETLTIEELLPSRRRSRQLRNGRLQERLRMTSSCKGVSENSRSALRAHVIFQTTNNQPCAGSPDALLIALA